MSNSNQIFQNQSPLRMSAIHGILAFAAICTFFVSTVAVAENTSGVAFEPHHMIRATTPLVNMVWAYGDLGHVVSDEDDFGQFVTPGVSLAYRVRPRKHLGIGVAGDYFTIITNTHVVHDIRTMFELMAVFPFRNNTMDISLGIDGGLFMAPYKKRWEEEDKDTGFGLGFAVGALVEYNWFVRKNLGLTAGLRAGYDWANQFGKNRHDFQILNLGRVDFGVVYRF